MPDKEQTLDEETKEEIIEEVENRVRSTDNEVIRGSMGMFTLKVDTHHDLEDAQQVFESIWKERISEIQEAESVTKRELEEEVGGLFF